MVFLTALLPELNEEDMPMILKNPKNPFNLEGSTFNLSSI